MNLIRVDLEARAGEDEARELVGLVDHVEYQDGIVRAHRSTSVPGDLIANLRKALSEVEEALQQADISLSAEGLQLAVSTEALIEDGGVWRRRGDIVTQAFGR